MLGTIKDYLRTNPRAYDTLKAVKRITLRQPDPAYEFFKQWRRGRRVNFIQIGAADGLRNDPFREFIITGWRGVLVEPLPDVFQLLKRNYAHCKGVTFVNAAVSDRDADMTFYGFDEKLLSQLDLETRLDYQRKASFTREHVERFVKDEHRWGIKGTTIPCLSLQSLLAKHWDGSPVQLLALDVEGHEPEIIQSLGDFRPEAIFYESHNLLDGKADATESLLKAKGYVLQRILGDTVALLGN